MRLADRSLAVALLVVAGLLAWTLVSLLVNFPKHPEHPPAYEVAGFVFLKQPDDITCGPTSAAMLLNRYGRKVSVKEVEAATKTKWFRWKGEDVGMTAPDYVAHVVASLGVPCRLVCCDVEMLKRYVSLDRPCVVLLRSGQKTWHYVVVIGYDEGHVFIADPGDGARETLSLDTFRRAWGFTGDMDGNNLETDVYVESLRLADIRPDTLVVPERPVPRH